jgi:hypothetical protein
MTGVSIRSDASHPRHRFGTDSKGSLPEWASCIGGCEVEISDRLIKLADFYHREARKCLKGRAYLAACAMQGAALEASLHAMCFLYPREMKKTTVYQKKKFRTTRNKALEFKYYELINIADELGWFPPKRITWGKGRRWRASHMYCGSSETMCIHPCGHRSIRAR